jgi:hypothetical protein
MGDLAEEVAAKNTYLFGHEVAPYLRDLWADQPDHWTPEVSQARVAANAPRPVLTRSETTAAEERAAAK